MSEVLSEPLTNVAIVGTAPTSKLLAPFDDKSWVIWACSGGNVDQLPRVNVWFELHALIEMTGAEMKGVGLPLYKWLREKSEDGSFDVIMLEAGSALGGKLNTFVPKAIPFPRDEMVALFGRNWFTSSVAYMMALAIARGAKRIGLFGVDMAAQQEHYEAQRAGLVRWIEIAQERGIQIDIPPESCLNASPPMYGYSEGTAFGRRMNAQMALMQNARAAASQQERAAHDQGLYFDGALEQQRYMIRTWTDGVDMDADLGHLEEAYAKRTADAAQPVAAPQPAIPPSLSPDVSAVKFEPFVPVAQIEPITPVLTADPVAAEVQSNGHLYDPVEERQS